MSTTAWIKSLELIAGNAAVTTDDAALESHAVQGVKPACVCAPETPAQAAEVIKFAAQNKIPVLPRGGGTGQGIGSRAPDNAIALSTKRMNALIAHEPEDMVATVQAGMTLGDFQEALGKNGQWLPLDGDPHSTIGGLIATDRSGPRALGYGTLRDMVLGMTVVNGDGVLRKCGGKVVKNVTGYDLSKLYIGSLGTLGLVTEVTFKLRPLAIERHCWQIGGDEISETIKIALKIDALNLPLEGMVFGESLGLLDNKDFHEFPPSGIYIVAAGTKVELDRIGREITAIAPKPVRRELSKNALLYCVCEANEMTQKLPGGPVNSALVRFWCVRSVLPAVLAMAKRPVVPLLTPGGGTFSIGESENIGALQASLQKAGVNYRFEDVRGLKIEQPFGPPRPEWPLMKQIRTALDPQGIMNPGRFVV
jgi:FAD/FMN-containing dehydrogenase